MARMVLLGLLRHRPMHGYELQQIMLQSRMDMWTNMLPGSIYYALNKMEEEGLVRTVAEERTGARLRKIYGMTEKGEAAFRDELKKALLTPPHSVKSDFSAAVAMIDGLPKEEAIELLESNAAAVRETIRSWRAGQAAKEDFVSEAVMLTIRNGIERMELDAAYLERLIAWLRSTP